MNQAITEGARILEQTGDPDSRRTARLLLGYALDADQTHLIAHPEETIEQDEYERYLALISRKSLGEPLQYLTGHQEFFGLDFLVTPDVLIPRPETEHLVERVLKLAESADSGETPEPASPLTIADIGTGSGSIAVALAVGLPGARIVAADISPAALDVARRNAEQHRVIDRIEFVTGDLLHPLDALGLKGKLDVIASNPPYIAITDYEKLEREVRDFEPRLALFGGNDGLDFYRSLVAESSSYLKAGGYLVCEIGYLQLDAIGALVDTKLWETMDVIQDLQNLPRTLTLRLSRTKDAVD